MNNIAKIKLCDVANGEGISTSVFFSGCAFRCKGCFNEDLWDFNIGYTLTEEVYQTQIKSTINEHIDHLSILGGEPFHVNNIVSVFSLISWFKKDFPDKKIWLWTGATFEYLISEYCGLNNYLGYCCYSSMYELLGMIDVLVDGKYEEDKRDLSLKWCGSSNQRVIDVQESLKKGEVVLYDKNGSEL